MIFYFFLKIILSTLINVNVYTLHKMEVFVYHSYNVEIRSLHVLIRRIAEKLLSQMDELTGIVKANLNNL